MFALIRLTSQYVVYSVDIEHTVNIIVKGGRNSCDARNEQNELFFIFGSVEVQRKRERELSQHHLHGSHRELRGKDIAQIRGHVWSHTRLFCVLEYRIDVFPSCRQMDDFTGRTMDDKETTGRGSIYWHNGLLKSTSCGRPLTSEMTFS